MDYNECSVEELEEMLDNATENYANGDLHHSSYTIIFNELYEALTEKKRPRKESLEDAYNRAMQVI